ncbi:MAG: flagellar biosynthesis protein FlhF [Phycisphaerales bacterium]
MTIKTYRGRSIAEALTQVKDDLGPDAVILHTKTYKSKARLGAADVTEITATTQACLERRRERFRAAPSATPAAAEAEPVHRPRPRERIAPRVEPTPTRVDPTPAPTREIPEVAIAPPPAAREVARRIIEPAAAAPVASRVEEELAAIRRMVGQVLQTSRGGAQPGMPEALSECYLKMLESEVASELADGVVGAVRDELSAAELCEPELVRKVVLRHIAAYIPACDEPPPMTRTPDGRPFTIALVGPTGVGKTTTIAKLAATYKLRHGKRLGLVTSDTYRIAAVEQLRTYANIIGLPLHVALTPTEMADSCQRCADAGADAVLIDTAGRAPRDAARLEELRDFLDAARPHQVHLVLSGSMSESVMRDAVERFAPLGPDHLIFTKLDEAVNFGVLVNVARSVDARLSFVTNGQEVPDHIEPGDADRIARLVLEGEGVG